MKIPNYIAGEWVDCADAIEVYNPATGQQIATVASATELEVNLALESAQAATLTYGELSINKRKELIDRLISLLKKNESEIVSLLIKETGKTDEIASYDFNMLIDLACLHTAICSGVNP